MDEAGQIYAPEASTRCGSRPRSCATAWSSRPTAASSGAAPLVRTIKRVQDTLGQLHDLQVLQTHVAAVQAGRATGAHAAARGARDPGAP